MKVLILLIFNVLNGHFFALSLRDNLFSKYRWSRSVETANLALILVLETQVVSRTLFIWWLSYPSKCIRCYVYQTVTHIVLIIIAISISK